jgi:hypothetical protein
MFFTISPFDIGTRMTHLPDRSRQAGMPPVSRIYADLLLSNLIKVFYLYPFIFIE